MTVLLLLCASQSLAVEFRTINGAGNNPVFTQQGAAGTRVIRFGYEADYPDEIGDTITAAGKPNPRDVSNALMAQTASIVNDRGLSDWIVHWGQFITHDMSRIPTGAQYNDLSTGATGDFRIPLNDPSDVLGPGPMPFNRSQYDPNSGNGSTIPTSHGPKLVPRWQINVNTSYLDASNVYGSDATTAASLRTFADGKLATSGGGLLPPLDVNSKFLAGDVRVNENAGLTAIHALFVREHNRLADLIQGNNPLLTDDQVYQWARKIVGAEVQAITYREFLPALMGSAAPSPGDHQYSLVDASITTAFSTAAFRYGHSMQSPQLKLVDDAGVEVGELSLTAAMTDPSFLSDPDNVGLLLKGMATQQAQELDAYIVDGLRNILFGPPGSGGIDLAALDIQRGRDLGLLNNYNELRSVYNMPPVTVFSQVTSDPQVQAALASLYGTVDDLDAWVAMICEDHVAGSSLGLLAQRIIASQFERLRDGDRLFYTADPDLQNALVTSIIDLDSITLDDLIELNTGMTSLQDNVFFAVAAVPEPSTLALACVAVVSIWFQRRRV